MEGEWDSTGPKGLHHSVSAIMWLRVIFRRKLNFDLCSQCLFLEFFHWLFDSKAMHIPSQSVLKIGFLTKNGTDINHFVLRSHLMLRVHASGWRSVLQ